MKLLNFKKFLFLILSFIFLISISNLANSGSWFSSIGVKSSKHIEDPDLKEFLKFYDAQLIDAADRETFRDIFIYAYKLLIDNYVHELDRNKRLSLLNMAKDKILQKQQNLKKANQSITYKDITYSALYALYANLDPHTSWLNPEENKLLKSSIDGEYYGVGIILGVEEGDKYVKALKVIENGPAYKAGVRTGDYIYKINNKVYTSKQLDVVANTLKSKEKSWLDLEVIRNQKIKKFAIKRGIVHLNTVNYQILDNKYLYINIVTFNQNTTAEFRKVLKNINNNTKGIILDLRGNPGGLLYSSLIIADMFLEKGLLLSVKGRDPMLNTTYYATRGLNVKNNIPLVVLINNMTASASEIVSAALQQNDRAIVMGQQSFGKGSVQTIYDLKDGSSAKITIQLFYSPNGEALQGVGVIPNILVNPEHKTPFFDIRENSYNNKLIVDHSKKGKSAELIIDEKSCLPYGKNKDKMIGCAVKYLQGGFKLN